MDNKENTPIHELSKRSHDLLSGGSYKRLYLWGNIQLAIAPLCYL